MRSVSRHLLRVSVLAFASVASAQSTPEQKVDSLFSGFNQGLRPGLAISVVRDGKVLLAKGYGLASLEHRVPITSSTIFDVASISKQFTGLAVAMLIDQGRVSPSDDIRKYIPEVNVGQTITVDHLLHHTSGIRDWPGSLGLAGWRYDDVISFDQILDFAFHQRTLNFTPGSEYMYSNTGYNLLAEMVVRVTGKPFRTHTDEVLFAPLGMTSSHFIDDHRRVIPNRAFGYARLPNGEFRLTPDNLTAMGSSSLYTSADDLAKWVMNSDDPKVGGERAMTLTRTRGVLNDGSAIPYAFGISHGEYRGLPTLAHSGSWASFSTFVLHFPRQRFGVVVLANSASINASAAANQLADIFLEKDLGPRVVASPTQSGSVTVAPAILDRYAGTYRLGPGWFVRIRREGAVLKTQATREDEFPLEARSDSTFWVPAYNSFMVFRASAGQPTVLSYRDKAYTRLPDWTPPPTTQLGDFAGDYDSDELGTSYRIEVQNGQLTLTHRRHGATPLTRLWQDEFGAARLVVALEFQRDSAGRVTGFLAQVDGRSRNIRFTRRS